MLARLLLQHCNCINIERNAARRPVLRTVEPSRPPLELVFVALRQIARSVEILGRFMDLELQKRERISQSLFSSLISAQPWQGRKKGADSGIDGIRYFQDDGTVPKRLIVSVKGGENLSVSMVRDLKGVLEREKAEIGIMITLIRPTLPMLVKATSAGFYVSPLTGLQYPRLQLLTVGDLLENKARPMYPDIGADRLNFKKAEAVGADLAQRTLFK